VVERAEIFLIARFARGAAETRQKRKMHLGGTEKKGQHGEKK
jgi:hypothetical protein